MQRASVGFPMEVHERARYFRIDIIRLDSQRTVQYGFFFGEAPEMMVTERNLLERESVAGVEINGAFQTVHRLFLFALATLDITL